MERYEILTSAAKHYHPVLADIKPSVFSVLDNLLRGIKYRNEAEEERRKRLLDRLEVLRDTRLQTIGGCKSEDVKSLISRLFISGNGRFVNTDLDRMNCHEIHLYFAYISRLAQCKYDLPGEMQKELQRAAAERKAVAQQEEQARKEREEESAREMEQRRSQMTAVERDIFDIENGVGEEAINKILRVLREYGVEDQVKVAKVVKAWFIINGKWEGKQSPKQRDKKSYIEGVLSQRSEVRELNMNFAETLIAFYPKLEKMGCVAGKLIEMAKRVVTPEGFVTGPLVDNELKTTSSELFSAATDYKERNPLEINNRIIHFQGSGLIEPNRGEFMPVALPLSHTAAAMPESWIATVLALRELHLGLQDKEENSTYTISSTGIPINAGLLIGYVLKKSKRLQYWTRNNGIIGSDPNSKAVPFEEKIRYPKTAVDENGVVDMCVYIHAKDGSLGENVFEKYVNGAESQFQPCFAYCFKYINSDVKFSENTDLVSTAVWLTEKVKGNFEELVQKHGRRVRLHIFYNGFFGLALTIGKELPQDVDIYLHDFDGATRDYRPAFCLNRELFE